MDNQPMQSELKRFLELWDTLPPNIPRPRGGLKGARLAYFRQRICDPDWVEGYPEAIQRIAKIPGLLGENNRAWVANIDWFLRPRTVDRILEGCYDMWGTHEKSKTENAQWNKIDYGGAGG